MFGRLTAAVTLLTPAAPASVWAALEAAPRWPEVLADLTQAHLEGGRLVAGAIIRTRAVPGSGALDMTYRVLEAEKPHRLVLASELPGLQARSSYVLTPSGSGTSVTVSAETIATNAPGRLLWATRKKTMTAQLESPLRIRSQAMLALAERM